MPPQEKTRAAVEASLNLAATPPVLWVAFTDLGKWPRWAPGVKSACCVSGAEWTLGAQFQLDLELPFPAREWSGLVTFTEVQPTVAVAWEAEYPFEVAVLHSYRFRPGAHGTLMTIREAYSGGWAWLYHLSGFMDRRHRQFEAALQNLKTYLEVGA
jgi:hypothetical protein